MKKYLVSGVPPNIGGAGKLLAYLLPLAGEKKYQILCRPPLRSLRAYLQSGEAYKIPLDVLIWYFRKIVMFTKLSMIRGGHVLVFHPQTIGWGRVLSLCRRNRVDLFVLDNSFFCIRSYNQKEGEFNECFDCLGNVDNCDPICRPFPVPYRRSVNLKRLKNFAEISSGLRFFVQNVSQAKLLEKHFGQNVSTKLVGMKTPGFDEGDTSSLARENVVTADIVFHGNIVEAKGVRYVLELARHLSDLTFFIPDSYELIRSAFPNEKIPNNVKCQEMTWETGLRECVRACKLVLCPSLWSAPIEGALVKSILVNGHVAVVNTRYGFESEIPGHLLLRLDLDYKKAAIAVRSFLGTPLYSPEDSKQWMKSFLADIDLAKVFFDDQGASRP